MTKLYCQVREKGLGSRLYRHTPNRHFRKLSTHFLNSAVRIQGWILIDIEKLRTVTFHKYEAQKIGAVFCPSIYIKAKVLQTFKVFRRVSNFPFKPQFDTIVTWLAVFSYHKRFLILPLLGQQVPQRDQW